MAEERLEVAEGDDLSPEEKVAKFSNTTWYDTVCPQGHRCCINCTANGDWQRCVHTRFANCDVCGHPSSQHYAALH